jgi:hypothetical protein
LLLLLLLRFPLGTIAAAPRDNIMEAVRRFKEVYGKQ